MRFRFIIEDSALHLCDRSINDVCDFDEFVSVLDMGTFELSLKFNSGESDEIESRNLKNKNKKKKQPQFELTMSNNMLNVRTCADSCSALMKLVQYFASDGDLLPVETASIGGGASGVGSVSYTHLTLPTKA